MDFSDDQRIVSTKSVGLYSEPLEDNDNDIDLDTIIPSVLENICVPSFSNKDDPKNLSKDLLKQYLDWEGFGDHHIEVYDNWVCKTATSNITSRILKLENGNVVCFENLVIIPPRYTREGQVLPLTPKLAREQGITYGCDWQVDIVMRENTFDGREIERKRNVCIGNVPTMLKSHYCHLNGKTPEELARYGEDPSDPGGYFIISGSEKVVLLQEQLAVNKIFLMSIEKGSVVSRMTSNTPRGTSLIELAMDKKTKTVIKLRLPSLKNAKQNVKYKSINVLRFFRIFGINDPEEIKKNIARFIKPEYAKKSLFKLSRNLVDFIMFPDDIQIIMKKMEKSDMAMRKPERVEYTDDEKRQEVNKITDIDLFPHLNLLPGPDGETKEEKENRIITAKLDLLSIMIARFLEHLAGFRNLDDRDSWSNKKLEGAGRMMEKLFRDAWRKTLSNIQNDIKRIPTIDSIAEKLRESVITLTFHDSFITSNWGVKGSHLKTNIAQTLVRDSVVATFAHINTVDVSISRTDRQHNLRLVQNTQWGFIDCVSTPEGENAGIVKNLALTSKVSLDRDDGEIIRFIIGDEGKGLKSYVNPVVSDEYDSKLIVNGKFLGWCKGEETREILIAGRRNGRFFRDMSVIKEQDWLYVDTGPSRLVRPLLIVDNDQQLVINKYDITNISYNELMTNGSIEYISAWEQEYIKVATSFSVIKERSDKITDVLNKMESLRLEMASKTGEGLKMLQVEYNSAEQIYEKLSKTRPYTHCELDKLSILGVAAALIPWPDHNQAPRNVYQVSMGKQALGIYHSNHLNRFDGKTKVLSFPNRPIVETKMYEVIGLNERGPGENVNIAFMSFPYTEEDSFVVKKEFLDNGGFRICKYLTYKAIIKHTNSEYREELVRPKTAIGEKANRYNHIQENGLPKIGAPLKSGDCVIGKIVTASINLASSKTAEPINESQYLRVGDEGVVEKVFVTSDNKTTIVIVKLRSMRIPQEGDKFAPRNAQKGTIGLVMSDINLPMTKNGLIPDIIVNPHCMPSRLTGSYIMELLSSKHGAFRGEHIDASAFAPFEMERYKETMVEYGIDEYGYEEMYSGTSGKKMKAKIYSGPVFFQALKHHVKDKAQVRSTGQIKPMTRQPPKGRGNHGGLRFGEMERDACISHGASSFLRERLMLVSDCYQTVFCKTCGTFAVNADSGYRPCIMCKNTIFGKCTIPYAYKLLIHLLAAPGLNLRPEFATSDELISKIKKHESYKSHEQDAIEEIDEGEEIEDEEDDGVDFHYDE